MFDALKKAFNPPPIPIPNDPKAIQRALLLAHTYRQKAVDSLIQNPEEKKEPFSLLALAMKQLDLAHNANPNINLSIDEGEIPQARLRSNILMTESMFVWAQNGDSKALAIAEQARNADPTYAEAYNHLGDYHLQLKHRQKAIESFTKACELEPDNIEYAQNLDRAQNTSDAEIAAYYTANVAGYALKAAGTTLYVGLKTVQLTAKATLSVMRVGKYIIGG